ncbi:hypothetical protein L2E82_32690 [Cichorium intybus]|uniref:Uncharacterized protein n=1 Tax=Cichorium intybus TaxID=13427 RepID=A0ACB9BI63_CICIN|nr:hypothetical protein L2E82_32690 [Cichorium intybus]
MISEDQQRKTKKQPRRRFLNHFPSRICCDHLFSSENPFQKSTHGAPTIVLHAVIDWKNLKISFTISPRPHLSVKSDSERMKLSAFSRFLFGLILLSSLNQNPQTASAGESKEAYVTLLYGDEFVLGARVLGKSIRDTRSTKEMVVLVSDGVSDYAKSLLQADGWTVTPISLLENPNQVRPTRFWGVYTKLKIFNMTDYDKVVYLDADTIVVKNIDVLFKCGKFCANLKHSERLNSGVMVVEPSEKLFKDMVSKVTTLYSYTGGDQGFLNAYYSGFPSARVFDPTVSRPVAEMERLSTLYNADVGLYMLANKWMVDEKELCTRSLCDHARHIYYKFRSGGGLAYSAVSSSNINSNQQFSNGAHSIVPGFLGGISVVICHQRVSCDVAPWYYGTVMAFLAVAAPLAPGIFGITALFLRFGLMGVGGLIFACFMTYASEHLAIRSFMRGLEDRDGSRARNICYLCC